MGSLNAKSRPREASFEVTVIRADGRVEHHGTVAYWHRNPLRRWAWRLRRAIEKGPRSDR